MCFSAGASFGAGVLLAGAGAVTLRQAKSPNEWAFAAIPALFSIQQLSEGALWVALANPEYAGWQGPATYVFFFFAQIFWPVYIPFAVLTLERKPLRRKILRAILAAGILLAAYMVFGIGRFGVEAHIQECHIKYGPKYPFGIPRTFLYILIVGVPLFLSSYKRMQVFGIAVIASLALTILFFKSFLVSVWCFFAAIVSVVIWWVLRGNREPKEAVS